MKRRIIFFLFFSFLFIFSACQGSSPQEQSSAPQELSHPTVSIASPSPSSTATVTVTSTSLPTATMAPTETAIPTATPTEFTGFEDTWVSAAVTYAGQTTFYFYMPGVVSNYYGTVDGAEMWCEPDPDREGYMACYTEGKLTDLDTKPFAFYADPAKTFLVYEDEFVTTLYVPRPTPTDDRFIWPRADFTAADVAWAQKPPNCPERGINLTCETEYRKYDDGSCLVGMSCYDSCGFYYAVDTIKDKGGNWIGWGPCW